MADTVIEMVDAETIHDWLQTGDVVLVDVRERHEHAMAHIEHATLLPLSEFAPSALPDHNGKKLVFHCAAGIRCGVASQALAEAGFEGTIYRMSGGISAWASAGLPIVRG